MDDASEEVSGEEKDGRLARLFGLRHFCFAKPRTTRELWGELGFRLGSGRGGLWDGDFAVGALDAGSFALEVAEIIEAGAADFALAYDFYRADRGRVERENTLDAYAEADAADGEGGAGSAAFLGDNYTFKGLEAFFFLVAFTFFEADVHADGVAGAKVWKIGAQLRVVQFLDYRVHVLDSLQTHSGGACAL
jgi:hypothetical protein